MHFSYLSSIAVAMEFTLIQILDTEEHNMTKAISSIDFECTSSHPYFIHIDIWRFNFACSNKMIYLAVMDMFYCNKLQISHLFYSTLPHHVSYNARYSKRLQVWTEFYYLRGSEIYFPSNRCFSLESIQFSP